MLFQRDPPPAHDGPGDDTEDPESGCKLMDTFAIVIQLCLAAAAFSTLFIKRQREKPQRPVRIWALDVSKQLFSGIVVHSLNVVVSYLSGGRLEGQSNPCVWYFLNIFIDTTLGVGILWAILSAFQYVLVQKLKLSGFLSGVYGDPPLAKQMQWWLKQLAVYLVSLVIMKALVVLLFQLCPWLSDFGRWVLQWTMGNYKLQVVFVMLIFPLVMNIIQFWIVDSIVKHKGNKKAIRLSQASSSEEGLLMGDDSHTNSSDFDEASTRLLDDVETPGVTMHSQARKLSSEQDHKAFPDTYDPDHESVDSTFAQRAYPPSQLFPLRTAHSNHTQYELDSPYTT